MAYYGGSRLHSMRSRCQQSSRDEFELHINLPNKYSSLDWNPEPEALSSERVKSSPFSSMLALPSPHVMSKSWKKLPAEAAAIIELTIRKRSASVTLHSSIEEAIDAVEGSLD